MCVETPEGPSGKDAPREREGYFLRETKVGEIVSLAALGGGERIPSGGGRRGGRGGPPVRMHLSFHPSPGALLFLFCFFFGEHREQGVMDMSLPRMLLLRPPQSVSCINCTGLRLFRHSYGSYQSILDSISHSINE